MEKNRSNPGSAPAATIVVQDNEVEDRFELFVDGAPAGILAYQLQDRNYLLNHTEIDPDFEGRGMGSQLISRVLDRIRASGHGALPYCPFVQSYLQRHEEYLDLVPVSYRSEFDLPTD